MVLHDAGVPMMCCGEEMEVLQAGAQDGALEKHVPAVTVNGNTMQVVVGEVEHPMTEEHFIQWIMVVQGDKVQYKALTPQSKPAASFVVEPGDYTVYEYCNLHGLWKAQGSV